MTTVLVVVGMVTAEAFAQPQQKAQPQAKVKLGLSINDPRAFRGYTVLNPMSKKTTYLIDMEGRVVKTWESQHNSMHAAYLLENGNLFRVRAQPLRRRPVVRRGPKRAAGRIQEFGLGRRAGVGFPGITTKSNYPTTTRTRCRTVMFSWLCGTRRPQTRHHWWPGRKKSW